MRGGVHEVASTKQVNIFCGSVVGVGYLGTPWHESCGGVGLKAD